MPHSGDRRSPDDLRPPSARDSVPRLLRITPYRRPPMLYSLSISLAVVGLTSAVAIACSDTSDPSLDPTISAAKHGVAPTLTPQQSGTSNQLIGISAVNARVAWAAGAGGTFTVTTDGGNTWRAGVVPGAEALQFRDVEGVSERVAYLLSIGNGPDSRIYKTED